MLRLATLCFATSLLFTAPAAAQSGGANAEAREHFNAGNAHLERAERFRGSRQRGALEAALREYLATLTFVRSRNALFNTALVLERLERKTEAFAYYREYLAVRGLGDDERAEGERRLSALRAQVAVVSVVTDPAGAEIFVDRLDLASRGQSPIEVAVEPAQEHTVYARLAHHGDAERTVRVGRGEQAELRLSLEARPVAVTLEVMAPAGAAVTLDGERVSAGTIEVAPGLHVARLEPRQGTPVERRFEVRPGEPVRVRLELAGAAGASMGTLMVSSDRTAEVYLDRAHVGQVEVDQPLSRQLPSGTHMIEVRADGAETVSELVAVGSDATTRVQARMGAERKPLGPIAHIALGLTGAGAVATAILAYVAYDKKKDREAQCTGGNFVPECLVVYRDEVDSANLRADILLGVTGGLALTTLVLYLVNRPRGGSSLDVQASVTPRGADVSIGGRF